MQAVKVIEMEGVPVKEEEEELDPAQFLANNSEVGFFFLNLYICLSNS